MNNLSSNTSSNTNNSNNKGFEFIYEEESSKNSSKQKKIKREKTINRLSKNIITHPKSAAIKSHKRVKNRQSDPFNIREEQIRKRTLPSTQKTTQTLSTGKSVTIKKANPKETLEKLKSEPKSVQNTQRTKQTYYNTFRESSRKISSRNTIQNKIKKRRSDSQDLEQGKIQRQPLSSKENKKIRTMSVGTSKTMKKANPEETLNKLKSKNKLYKKDNKDLKKRRLSNSKSANKIEVLPYEKRDRLAISDIQHTPTTRRNKLRELNFEEHSMSTQDTPPVYQFAHPKDYATKKEIKRLVKTMNPLDESKTRNSQDNLIESETENFEDNITTPRNLLFAYRKITNTETLLSCCLKTLKNEKTSIEQKHIILKFCIHWLRSGLYKAESDKDEVNMLLEAIQEYAKSAEESLAQTTTRFKKALKKTKKRKNDLPPLPLIYLKLPINLLKSSKAKHEIDTIAEQISQSYGTTLKNISFEDLIFWAPELKEGAIQNAIEYNEQFQNRLIDSFSELNNKEKAKLAHSYLLIGKKLIKKRDYHSAFSVLSALSDFDNKEKIYENVDKSSKHYTALLETFEEISRISIEMVMPKFKGKIEKRKNNGEHILSPLFFVTKELMQSEEIPKYNSDGKVNTSYLKVYTKTVSRFIDEVKDFY